MHAVNANQHVGKLMPKHLRRRKSRPGPRQASCGQLVGRNQQDICELLAGEDICESCGPWPCRYSKEIAVVCRRSRVLRNRWKSSAFYPFRPIFFLRAFNL